MQDHLAKPVDRDLLIATLGRWIGAAAPARAGHRRSGPHKSRPIAAGDGSGAQAELDRLLQHLSESLAVVASGLAPLVAGARPPVDVAAEAAGEAGDGIADLAGLAGFDVAQGVRRVGGDVRFYRKLIGDFVRSQADAPDRIATALAGGDRRSIAEAAHLVRGLAANLSADRVAAQAALLEDTAPHGSDEALSELLASFRDSVAEVVAAVGGLATDSTAAAAEQRAAIDRFVRRQATPQAVAAQGPRILAVDDVPANLFVMGKMLQSLGVEATMAGSAAEALSAIDVAPFDMVITDCHMPDVSGFELAATIRADKDRAHHRTVIIGVSGNSGAADRERCLASGMDEFLAKPLSADAIGRILAQWLQGASA
jgi:CheY-like chemotaxis protein